MKRQPSAGATGTVVVPQVRYHPSIKTRMAGDGLGGEVRSTSTPPQTEPELKVHQQQAARPGSPGRSHGPPEQVQRAAAGSDPSQGPSPDPPRLEPVPVVLGEQLDEGVVKQVEVLTRGQRTNKEWFAWRRNRITASLAPSIARCRFVEGATLPYTYLAAIKGEAPRCQSKAMKWGISKEGEAVLRYQELKSQLLGHRVTVEACGLFIHPQRPWLAASPDGLVRDGPDRWLLEVKCPYKHRSNRVEDACKDKRFCLEAEPQQPAGPLSYSLKRSHGYFTQIQCQLAVTGLQRADLVVFTEKETVVVSVTFDPELWEDTLSKLERFYVAAYPRLEQTHAAAAIREL